MKFIYGIILCSWALISSAQLNQESQRIRYFSPHLQPQAWDGGKSSVYSGGAANVTKVGSAVPVDLQEGDSGALKIESSKPSGWWNIIFKISVHEVNFDRMGVDAFLKFRLRWSNIAPGADLRVELLTRPDDQVWGSGSDETASVLLSDYITPSTSWQDVFIPMQDFRDQNVDLNTTRVSALRLLGQGTYSPTNTMFIEAMDVVPSQNDSYVHAVKVNQIGYVTQQQKVGIVSFKPGAAAVPPTSFDIVEEPGGNVAFSGSLVSQTPLNQDWGKDNDEVYHADFTGLVTPGVYKMVVTSLGQESQVFEISDDVYNEAFRDALRFYYYARSGEEISEPFAEGFTRQAYYDNEDAAPYASGLGTRDVKGGWFDAGDLHKDIHAQVFTMWYLLETLEDFENKSGADGLNIPESNGAVKDLYPLIKYGLDWMAKMWNQDGSVHFWVDYPNSGLATIGEVSEVSSGSASVLAGLFAKAYPLFKSQSVYDQYADSLLLMAETSWSWLGANPNNVDPINPENGGSYAYAYSDEKDQAMRSFAAIELFNATGELAYNIYFTSRYSDPLTDYESNIMWGGIISNLEKSEINLAYIDYINSNQAAANLTIQNELRAEFLKMADWTIDRIGYTTYNIPLIAPNHLYWGSSGTIATYGYLYDQAYQWTNDMKYHNSISNCVDWLFGRNPVNRIFVSGYGDALHGTDIYSFYMLDISNQPPGYLVGNINDADASLHSYFPDPWKQYLNIQQASILEPGIYWNAEYAWLMGYMANNDLVSNTSAEESIDQLSVFPNPVNDRVHFGFDFDQLEVSSSSGEIVTRIDRGVTDLDVSSLSAGVYLLRFTTGDVVKTHKLVKH